MVWQQWFLVGWIIVSGALTISRTGQPCEPLHRFVAAFSVFEIALLVWLVLTI